MGMIVPFNKPLVVGTEKSLLTDLLESGRFSANGVFTEKCHGLLEKNLGFNKALLTTSCTSALELSAMLIGIEPGDEVIIPSYAFVTTANAFASKGAKVVFADSKEDNPNIDETGAEALITAKTKAIVALHYGGIACNLDAITTIAKAHNIRVIEDNAQGIGSTFYSKPLGGVGDLGAISFHDTKNVHCGEGGAVLINDTELIERASILWDMGTNKAAFKSGKVPSYGWVDVGSSFYPSELNAAVLYGQLQALQSVNTKRLELWQKYYDKLLPLEVDGRIKLPTITADSEHNGHTFYIVTNTKEERDGLINHLSKNGISAPFHFQALHRSLYFRNRYKGPELANADKFSDCLLRLPLFYALKPEAQNHVIQKVLEFYIT